MTNIRSALIGIMLFAGSVFADAGISMSYRSIPMELNAVGFGNSYHTMETVSVNIFFDDWLRARSDNTIDRMETTYYLRRYTPPTEDNPIGEIWYEKVDLNGVSREEYNTLNHKKPGMPGYIYAQHELIAARPKNSWLPNVINPSVGAGYIFGMNLNMGFVSNIVDMYSADLYIGKRITLIPHITHVYFKLGPSIMTTNWNDVDFDYRWRNTQLGTAGGVGWQVQILKGVKVYVESEFRVYGPFLTQETESELTVVNKMPFWDKNIEVDTNNKEESMRQFVRESLRFGVKFSF